MIPRLLAVPKASFLLLGPRGTGKSSWARDSLPDAVVVDLLEGDTYVELLASPERLGRRIPKGHRGWVVLDEVQKVPALLDEVHRRIERDQTRFALLGSSARQLRRGGVNLLAGRAVSRSMHPLTAAEITGDDDVARALTVGRLPAAHTSPTNEDARDYLRSYVRTYLREEVQAEGLTRNLAAFTRFLETASFSQGAVLNISAVSRECHVERKVAEDYFRIAEDLLIAVRLTPFTRRAQRRVVAHPKFYFFDAGVFSAIRPRGPLDGSETVVGPALETLVLQELRAINDYLALEYELHYWRTHDGTEVDFVLYGPNGLVAIEVKSGSRVRSEDLTALREFAADYPMARTTLVYGGTRRERDGDIDVVPVGDFLRELPTTLRGA